MSTTGQRAHPDHVSVIRRVLPADKVETTVRRFERLPQMQYIRPAHLEEWLRHPHHESQKRMLKTLACMGKLWATSVYPYVADLLDKRAPSFYSSVDDLDARAFMLEPPELFGDLARLRMRAGWAMEEAILKSDGNPNADPAHVELVATCYPDYGVQGRPDEVSKTNGVWAIADAKLATGKTKPPKSAPGYYAVQLHCYRLLLLAATSVPEHDWHNQEVQMRLHRRHLDEYARDEVGLERIGNPEAMTAEERQALVDEHTDSYPAEVAHDEALSEAIVEAGRQFQSRMRKGLPLESRPLTPYKPKAESTSAFVSPPETVPVHTHDDFLRQCLFGGPQ